MPDRIKLAVLISGRGSNMEAVLNASLDPNYPAEICMVLSDNPDAAGLETARNSGIETHAFKRSEFASKQDHEAAIMRAIDESGADLIVLAGYMRLLSEHFVAAYEGRLINIHPSLLPRHKGLDTHARALANGDDRHGCTVHFVNAEMDGGQIIAQSSLDVLPDDTPESLAKRVLRLEHDLYPKTIAALARGEVEYQS